MSNESALRFGDGGRGALPLCAAARALSKEIHHHLKEEESKFFKVAGRILAAGTKRSLAARYRREIVRMRKRLAAT